MIYCVIKKDTKHVLQMGIRDYAVKINDPASEELVSLDVEKPTELSECYYKVVDGKLKVMTQEERGVVDTRLNNDSLIKRAKELQDIIRFDPEGFKQALGR